MRRCGLVRITPVVAGVTPALCNSPACGQWIAARSGKIRDILLLTSCVATILLLSGCIASKNSSSSLSGSVSVSSGSGQAAVVGAAFGAPLVAKASIGGSPASGVSVIFTAPSSGASGTFANGKATESDTTDANGLATSTTFTANSITGEYAVTATATASGQSASVNFGLANTAAPVLVVNAQNGSAQTALVGTAFTLPLSAVVDQNGSPVSGVTVTFMAPSSGASGTFANGKATEFDSTDSSGIATSTAFTANATAGQYVVTATIAGASAPANFSLSNTTPGVFATGGVTQNAAVGTTFNSPLVATVVDSNGNPLNGVSVTFTAPASGASGTFAGGLTTQTVVSDASGHATSFTFTANATAGGPYNVTATVGSNTANFLLTNTSVPVTSYAFYMSGLSQSHASVGQPGLNFYALAGAVTIDQSGNVTGGEEDYNDGNGYTYAKVPITSTGSSLTVNSTTGQGTLVLVTNNTNLGVNGQQTFGMQFVNTSHALITQFDGAATSSGSMDVQNLSTVPTGGYAFTMSGVDPGHTALAFGGVLAFNGNLANPQWPGLIDINDTGVVPTSGTAFVGSVSAVDAYGRGQISGIAVAGVALTLDYYQIGPEAMRIIDVDSNVATVGSAFGQGTNANSATTAGLGASVFAIAGNPYASNFGVLGQFTTDGSGNLTSGVADDNEFGNPVSIAAAIAGTYQVSANGYGNIAITSGNLGNVTGLRLYLTDPNLNLNDPNSTSGRGGAMLMEFDQNLPGGTGVVTPQSDTSTGDFNGLYAAGWQAFNQYGEFDMLAQGTMNATSKTLSLQGLVNDPFAALGVNPSQTLGDTFQSQPSVDTNNPGRYTMLTANSNQLQIMITTTPPYFDAFDAVLYQASGGQLYWMEVDTHGVFVGPLQQQGSLTGIPAAKRRVNMNNRPSAAAPPDDVERREPQAWMKRTPSTP